MWNRVVLIVAVVATSLVAVATPAATVTNPTELWPTPELASDPNAAGSVQWLSADGSLVFMRTSVSGTDQRDWLIDRDLGTATEFDPAEQSQFSADGRWRLHTRRVGSSTTIWMEDLVDGTEIRVDTDPTDPGYLANNGLNSTMKQISADGSVVVFAAQGFWAAPPNPPGQSGNKQLFAFERDSGTVTLVSDPTANDQVSPSQVTISGDGRWIAYFGGDPDALPIEDAPVYLFDLETGIRQLVDVANDPCRSYPLVLSFDGARLAHACFGQPTVIDIATGESRVIGGPDESVYSISDDGDIVGIRGGVYSWSNDNADAVDVVPASPVFVSGDGSTVAWTTRPPHPRNIVYVGDTPNFIDLALNPDAVAAEVGETITIDVFANDAGFDSSTLSVFTLPLLGNATVTPAGTIEYDAVAAGLDEFRYEACEDDFPTNCRNIAVTISVTVPNVGPTANDDVSDTIMTGDGITVDVLANDTDPDDGLDPSSLAIVTQGSLGTATITTGPRDNPVIEYAAGTIAGDDAVVYFICDFAGDCATASLFVTLIDPLACTIIGTSGPDVLTGTEEDDVICGLGGADTIDGLAGNDLIIGGGGADVIRGGPGDDVIRGGGGDDDIRGGSGDDDIRGGRGNDIVRGNSGSDVIRGGQGDDELRGGQDDDEVRGQSGNDAVLGGAGDDLLRGGLGVDDANGGAGIDDCNSETVTNCEPVVPPPA